MVFCLDELLVECKLAQRVDSHAHIICQNLHERPKGLEFYIEVCNRCKKIIMMVGQWAYN